MYTSFSSSEQRSSLLLVSLNMDGSCIDESTTSDSISTSLPALSALPATKSPESLCRVGSGTSVILDSESSIEAESRKLPSSRFKGVVPQPNGRWGAQIYEKHQRVWLGTFNEEEEAAKAYDIAAQRFRGRDAVTNFKPLSETEEDDIEAAFLNCHSKAEIVDMLRKHTYNDELEQSKRNYGLDANGKRSRAEGLMAPFGSDRVTKSREQLFEKTVTPSDVGKLNRLVIPKQHAEKHFPLQTGTTSKGVLLNFEDMGGKVWRFRYSYWNSSQSYVLTKGWSRFVKEKNLKAGDIVSFQRSTGGDKQLYIDWKARNGPTNQINPVEPVEMVRLFGVNIFKVPVNSSVVVANNGSWTGNKLHFRKLVVVSKRISGLEEAMRIQRQKELREKRTFRRRIPLRRGRVSPRLPVPDHIPKPPYLSSTSLPELSSEHQIHDSEGISRMKAACELAARVLDYAGTLVRPSVTTNEIDKAVHQMIIEAGAYPSPLGYGGFPKSVCTSVNECMCHGIPDSRQLQDGDIINIDVTVYFNGYHGDTSKTFLCGNVTDGLKRLVRVTEECMERGIACCKDGASFKKIGKRIRYWLPS